MQVARNIEVTKEKKKVSHAVSTLAVGKVFNISVFNSIIKKNMKNAKVFNTRIHLQTPIKLSTGEISA